MTAASTSFLCAVLLLAAPAAFAADLQHGRRIAAEGMADAAACAGCHGTDGAGAASATPPVPRLGGQVAEYLVKQLADFADGTRPGAVMAPIAQALGAADRADVAAYFASRGDAPYAAPDLVAAQSERGRLLVESGAPDENVQACNGCHGPEGEGRAPDIPQIGGQPAAYLLAQLQAWAQGGRRNDSPAAMRRAVHSLTAADAEAVAGYLAALRPLPPTQAAETPE